MNSINARVYNSLKWSSLSELIAKIISPFTNMILARLLAPEVFGIVATVTMVVSFAEIFVDSGFNKVLVQRTFVSPKQEQQFMSVAFWSTLSLSLVIWFIIACFNSQIAKLVGNEGYGYLFVIAGVLIPLYGIVGILNSRIRKKLEFNKLFIVRLASALVPLFVTVPLAIWGFEYWSLIIGNIAGVLIRAIMLYRIDSFKPSLYFSFNILHNIISSGIWIITDGLAVWATNWLDIILISKYMDAYQLGLYKNSTSTISSIFSLITTAIAPVMFSALSQLKDQKDEFNLLLLNVQKVLCMFILPMGIGIFFYRNWVTNILFGKQWAGASDIIGIFSLTSACRIIFVSIYSDAYRAKGKFFLPFILQIIDLVILIPSCIVSAKDGFWVLVYVRSLIKLDLIIPEILCIWIVCGISLKKTFNNIFHILVATVVMTCSILLFPKNQCFLWVLISIIVAIFIYFGVLMLFKKERRQIISWVVKTVK